MAQDADAVRAAVDAERKRCADVARGLVNQTDEEVLRAFGVVTLWRPWNDACKAVAEAIEAGPKLRTVSSETPAGRA